MQINFASLRVNRVIFHDVPKRAVQANGPGVTFSQVESRLNPASANYLRERVGSSLRSAGHDVRFISDTSSPVPSLLTEYIESGTSADFVGISRRIAQHLYASQTGVNSPGLLCLAGLSLHSSPAVAILKLDRESAVHIDQVSEAGRTTYSLEHVRNLILSNRARVFKASIFASQDATGRLGEIQGKVSDNQRGFPSATGIADFFLTAFLGCELIESPEVSTRGFFAVAEEFISEEVPDSELKTRYETALIAEMNSERVTISPVSFAEDYLQLNDRNRFLSRLEESDLTTRPFVKDTQLIRNHLRKISYDFQSGVKVMAPLDTIEKELVGVSQMDDGRTHLEVRDNLKDLKGQ